MSEIRKIIATACLAHSDSGEASKDREARLILDALKEGGYTIIKPDSSLGQTFDNNFDCYADVDRTKACLPNWYKDKDTLAMTKGKFIEVVGGLLDTKQPKGYEHKLFLFKVRDYTTELIGRYDKDKDCYYVQRGDGSKYEYDSYRITWKKELTAYLK